MQSRLFATLVFLFVLKTTLSTVPDRSGEVRIAWAKNENYYVTEVNNNEVKLIHKDFMDPNLKKTAVWVIEYTGNQNGAFHRIRNVSTGNYLAAKKHSGKYNVTTVRGGEVAAYYTSWTLYCDFVDSITSIKLYQKDDLYVSFENNPEESVDNGTKLTTAGRGETFKILKPN